MSSAMVRQTPPPISISPLSDASSPADRATAMMSYAAESRERGGSPDTARGAGDECRFLCHVISPV